MIHVFTRTWWKENNNGEWPDNREPQIGRKKTIRYVEDREIAVKICDEWNKNNANLPQNKKFGRMAEFQSEN